MTGTPPLPPVETSVRWPVLLLLPLLGVPATVASNAWEYVVTARLLAHRVPPVEATRVSVLSTAANLLPLPGAVLVRARDLRLRGTRYGRAFSVTALVGLVRVGVAGLLAGTLAALDGDVLLGAVAVAAAAVVVAASVAAVARQAGGATPAGLAAVLLVEVVAVLVIAARLHLTLVGLGYDASLTQSLALSLAGVIGSAVGFLPAGLGVRELLAAAIGPLVGLPAAVSLVVTAVDRVVGLVVLAAISGVLLATGGASAPAAASEDGDEVP